MHPIDQMSLAWVAVVRSCQGTAEGRVGGRTRDGERRWGRCEGARGGEKEGEKEGDDAWRREGMARNVSREADRGSRCRQRPNSFARRH